MSTSCSSSPGCRATTRCAPNSSRRATSRRCRSRRWRPMPTQTGHQYVKALIADGEAKDWIAGRQLIDLIATFPIALDAEQLRALTRPLAPRAYSIASSRREVGDEAHLLISAVRYESHRPRPQGRRLELTSPSGSRRAAACASSSSPTSISRCPRRQGHHHGRPRHRRRAVPRLRAGAPRRRAPPAKAGCSSATAPSPTTSSTSSTGRRR